MPDVKMEVYRMLPSLKTYQPTLHFTPWSLDLFIRVSFQIHGEHTDLQPFRRIELIVHIVLHLCPTRYSFTQESGKACKGVKCFPMDTAWKQCLNERGDTLIFF